MKELRKGNISYIYAFDSLDDCFGDYLDEEDKLIISSSSVGDREKREKLLDRSFDEW